MRWKMEDMVLEASEKLIECHDEAREHGRVRQRVVQDASDAFDYATGNKHRVSQSAYNIRYRTRRLTVSIKISNMDEWEDPTP